MQTKQNAAMIVTAKGTEMIIANGTCPEKIYDIVEGKEVGTRFLAAQ